MLLRTSAIGRAVLTAREGCRLTAYLDSVGVSTIGVGHTGRTAPPAVKLGMTITQAEADSYLAADLAPTEAAIYAAVAIVLADHEFDALVSFAFNIGVNGFAGSTTVKKLNAGDREGAGDAMLLWEKPASLSSRREAERKQFLTAYSAAMPVARIGEPSIKVSGTASSSAAPAPRPTPAPPIASPRPLPAPPAPPPPKLGWLSRLWIALTFRKAA